MLAKRHPDNALDDESEHEVIAMTVFVLRPRGEVERALCCHKTQELRHVSDKMSGYRAERTVVAQAASVLEQIADANWSSIVWQLW